MVVSLLKPSVSYKENKSVDDDDLSMDVEPFIVEMKEVNVIAAIGNEKYTYITDGIVVIPIYLFFNDRVVGKIGYYELPASKLENLLDSDGQIDVDRLNEPLLFSFVTQDYLTKYKVTEDMLREIMDNDEDDDSGDEDESVVVVNEDDNSDEEESDEEESDEEESDEEESDIVKKITIIDDDSDSLSDDELAVESLDSIIESTKDQDIIPKEKPLIEILYEEDSPLFTSEEESSEELKQKKYKLSDLGENKKENQKIQEKYKGGSNWLQKIFKNNNYTLEDNAGGGDCFFYVLTKAFKSVGKDVTVQQLRKILADEATDDIFQNYKQQFDMFNGMVTTSKDEIKGIREQLRKIKTIIQKDAEMKKSDKKSTKRVKFGTSERNKTRKTREPMKSILKKENLNVSEHRKLSTDDLKKLRIKVVSLNAKLDEAKNEEDFAEELLREFRFMEDINTLDEFKKILQTCKFWAETWAISTLERVLNIKLIILSTEAYERKDYNGIIQCGQLNDTILQERGSFTPKYYFITEWLGYHYKSVMYKGKKALTFEEIPYMIKNMIVEKCMEKGAGPYSLIPKFELYKQKIMEEGLEDSKSDDSSISSEESSLSTSLSRSLPSESVSSEPSSIETGTTKSLDSPLNEDDIDYDTVFRFYNKSSDKAPGKGAGEKMDKDPATIKKYAPLKKMKDWRRSLSNMFEAPINLDGLDWLTVEHYYQANKYKDIHPDVYKSFSLNSESEMSLESEIARAYGESGRYKEKQIRPINVKTKPSYFDGEAKKVLKKAIFEKFKTYPQLKDMLLATKDAMLREYIPGKPDLPAVILMEVRKELSE